MNEVWKNVYNRAKSVINPKRISDQICSGGVGAAVVSKSGAIYTGVCIDTDCSLGMCAERNAISTMITNGEYEIIMIFHKSVRIIPSIFQRALMMYTLFSRI